MTIETSGTDALVIEKTLELDAPIERVWAAITDPEELSRWFPDRVDWKLEAGSEGFFLWHDYGSFEVQVVEVVAPHRFAWRWTGSPDRPLQEHSTLVEWELTARAGGGTTLLVRESGFDSRQKYEENRSGWSEELAELVDYLTTDSAAT